MRLPLWTDVHHTFADVGGNFELAAAHQHDVGKMGDFSQR